MAYAVVHIQAEGACVCTCMGGGGVGFCGYRCLMRMPKSPKKIKRFLCAEGGQKMKILASGTKIQGLIEIRGAACAPL